MLFEIPAQLYGQRVYWKAIAMRLVGPVGYLFLAVFATRILYAVLTDSPVILHTELRIILALAIWLLLVAVTALVITGRPLYEHSRLKTNTVDLGCGVVLGLFVCSFSRELLPDRLGVVLTAVTLIFLLRRIRLTGCRVLPDRKSLIVFVVAVATWMALCPQFVALATWSSWAIIAGLLCSVNIGQTYRVKAEIYRFAMLLLVTTYAVYAGIRDADARIFSERRAFELLYSQSNVPEFSLVDQIVPQVSSLLAWLSLLILLPRLQPDDGRSNTAKLCLIPTAFVLLGLWAKIGTDLMATYETMPPLFPRDGRETPVIFNFLFLDLLDIAFIALVFTPGLVLISTVVLAIRGTRPSIVWMLSSSSLVVLTIWTWDLGVTGQADPGASDTISLVGLVVAVCVWAIWVNNLHGPTARRDLLPVLDHYVSLFVLTLGALFMTTQFVAIAWYGMTANATSWISFGSGVEGLSVAQLQDAVLSTLPTAAMTWMLSFLLASAASRYSRLESLTEKLQGKIERVSLPTHLCVAFTFLVFVRHVSGVGINRDFEVLFSGLLGAVGAVGAWWGLHRFYRKSINQFALLIGALSILFFQSILGVLLAVALIILGGPFETIYRSLNWPNWRSIKYATIIASSIALYMYGFSNLILAPGAGQEGTVFGSNQWLGVAGIFVATAVMHPLNACDVVWSELYRGNERIKTLVFWVAIPGLIFLFLLGFLLAVPSPEQNLDASLEAFILSLAIANFVYIGLMGWVAGGWLALASIRSDGMNAVRELRHLSEQEHLVVEGIHIRPA